MVDGEEGEGLDELGLGGAGADGDQGLAGEDRGALGHGPHVAGEAERPQVVQEVLLEEILAPQEGDVVLIEVEVPDVVYQLFQSGGDGEAASVGHPAEEDVEVGDAVLHPAAEVAVCHGHFVEVEKHGEVELLFALHKS